MKSRSGEAYFSLLATLRETEENKRLRATKKIFSCHLMSTMVGEKDISFLLSTMKGINNGGKSSQTTNSLLTDFSKFSVISMNQQTKKEEYLGILYFSKLDDQWDEIRRDDTPIISGQEIDNIMFDFNWETCLRSTEDINDNNGLKLIDFEFDIIKDSYWSDEDLIVKYDNTGGTYEEQYQFFCGVKIDEIQIPITFCFEITTIDPYCQGLTHYQSVSINWSEYEQYTYFCPPSGPSFTFDFDPSTPVWKLILPLEANTTQELDIIPVKKRRSISSNQIITHIRNLGAKISDRYELLIQKRLDRLRPRIRTIEYTNLENIDKLITKTHQKTNVCFNWLRKCFSNRRGYSK